LRVCGRTCAGQRTLPPSSIAGISNLVAASVEGLRPDAVVILDSFGRPLARPSEETDIAGAAGQIERQQRLERDMSARVVALLEPVVGIERVRVNVTLKLNPATVEQTEERFDPASVVRSRQVTADTSSSTPAGGLAGSRGNTPPDPPDPKNPVPVQTVPPLLAAGTGASRTTETTNFDISRTMVVTQRPPGEVARMSVAVIVDDSLVASRGEDGAMSMTRRPRTPEELQQIQGLVSAAVGFEVDRGDQMTVQNISFEEPVVEDAVELTTMEQVQRYVPQIWEGARLLVAGLIGILALFLFVRPLMQRIGSAPARRSTQGMALASGEGLRTVSDMESEIEAQLDASAVLGADGRRLPVLVRRASTIGAKEPENVAKLLSGWISEGER
jgi:flagellar M-ring protein FliF